MHPLIKSRADNEPTQARYPKPRILIICRTPVNTFDSTGTIRMMFRNWGDAEIAQIYSTQMDIPVRFCQREYCFGAGDRRFGWLFHFVKRSPLAASVRFAGSGLLRRESDSTSGSRALLSKLGKKLIDSGLWELIFLPKPSRALLQWVREFDPEVIYFRGTDMSYTRLALKLHKTFGTPLCVHMVDDWTPTLYNTSPVRSLMQWFIEVVVREICEVAQWRFALGERMANELSARYGLDFQVLMNCDDPSRFSFVRHPVEQKRESVVIVYSGGLGMGRWKGILELAEACRRLVFQGIEVTIDVYSYEIPIEAGPKFRANPRIRFKGALPDEEVPRTFSNADILFLPESFEKSEVDYLRCSISTKAHLYMMSGRPILVYGPPVAGVVDYARSGGWGWVVDRQSVHDLEAAVTTLATGNNILSEMLENARLLVAKHHDVEAIQSMLVREFRQHSPRQRRESGLIKASGRCCTEGQS